MDQVNSRLPRHSDRLVLGISLGAMIVAGCSYILCKWLARHDAIDGVLRCLTFICAMVAAYVWGYQAYRRQWDQPSDPQCAGYGSFWARAIGNFRELRTRVALSAVLVQQGIVLLFSSSILDGGTVSELCAASVAVYWASLGVITCARNKPMDKRDITLASSGFFPLLGIVSCSALLVWRLKGLL